MDKSLTLILLFIAAAALLISGAAANSQPVIKDIGPQTPTVGNEYKLKLGATDADGDKLVFSDNTEIFNIDPETGLVKFTPNPEHVGIHGVEVSVSDGTAKASKKIRFVVGHESDFEISQRLISVSLRKGEKSTRKLRVKNTGENPIVILLESSLPSISHEPNLSLDAGQEKTTDFTFASLDETGIFTDEIILYGGGQTKKIPTIVERESATTNYVVRLDIPAEFRELESGQELTMNILISRKSGEGVENIIAHYQIMDLANNIVFEETEDVVYNKELSKSKTFSLPSYLKQGDYIAGVTITRGDSKSISTKVFSIRERAPALLDTRVLYDNLLYILITIIVIILIVIYLNYGKLVDIEKRQAKKSEKIYRKFLENKESGRYIESAKNKLERQLKTLDKARKSNYISQESYDKCRKRIEKMLKRVNKYYKKELL